MLKVISTVTLALMLTGCVSAGTKVSEQQVQQFKKGVTTEDEVIATLGQPTTSTIKDDGTRLDVYAFTHASPTAVTYIPIVGLFAGGAHGTTTNVSLSFDKDHILTGYTHTVSNVDVHTGITN